MANDLTTLPDSAKAPAKWREPTGKTRVALDAMVWQGLSRKEAANLAQMSDKTLYHQLRKGHVKAYYAGALQVLRLSERARNIHRLVAIRDGSTNAMASVQAVKALEQLAEPGQFGGVSVNIFQAGYVIDLRDRPDPCVIIDAAESARLVGTDAGSAADANENA